MPYLFPPTFRLKSFQMFQVMLNQKQIKQNEKKIKKNNKKFPPQKHNKKKKKAHTFNYCFEMQWYRARFLTV